MTATEKTARSMLPAGLKMNKRNQHTAWKIVRGRSGIMVILLHLAPTVIPMPVRITVAHSAIM